MSKATAALVRACKKLSTAIDGGEYLVWDCELAGAVLLQDDFDATVEEFEGDEHAARVQLGRQYRRDLRKMLADLARLINAATAVRDVLPAVAAEQLAALDKYEYWGEDE